MKKVLKAIWEPFDSEDWLEYVLLGFGFFWLVVILAMEVVNLWAS